MQKEKKDKHFIKKPIYEGGPKAMKEFVQQNLQYPKEALKNKTEGSVTLRYSINYKGKVIEAKVISGLSAECDEEAIRLVKTFKFTVPRNRGVRALFHKTITIHFRLPKQSEKKIKPKPTTPKSNPTPSFSGVQYNIVPSKKEEEKVTKTQKKTSYTITINL